MDKVDWKDASKVLPDDGIEVLCNWALDSGGGMLIGFLDGEVWRTVNDEIILDPPTHWMNLPEMPYGC